VLGHHAGFSDLFVPVEVDGRPPTVLVTGPFSTVRPTRADLLSRWRWLTGRAGHASDPAFSRYVAITLDTLLLEGEQLARFRRMVEILATLCAGRGDAHALGAEAYDLRTKVEAARFVNHTWEAARTMVDESTARTWLSGHKRNELWDVGLQGVAEHVLVGLVTSRRDASDGVAEMLAYDAFQRACVGLARGAGDAVCGRVAERGVMFLTSGARAPARSRDHLVRLAEKARALARRDFALELHVGIAAHDSKASIEVRYEDALGAAESALSKGVAIVTAVTGTPATSSPLRRLRDQLGDLTAGRPGHLMTTFERYVDAVCTHCGFRLEAVHAHLDAGFDGAVRALHRAGVIDERSRRETCDAVDRAAKDANDVSELVGAYRRAMTDLIAAAEHPVRAAQDRSLGRSLAFIARRFTEPIALADVARVAGFAPRHFARLFRAREATTFEAYLRNLRVERAKQLLDSTELSIEKVAQLSGFALRPHFHRTFRKAVGKTPAEYRHRMDGY